MSSLQLNPYVAYEIPYSHSFEIFIQKFKIISLKYYIQQPTV